MALKFKSDWFQGLKGKGKAASPLGSLDGTIDPDQYQVGLEATDLAIIRNSQLRGLWKVLQQACRSFKWGWY